MKRKGLWEWLCSILEAVGEIFNIFHLIVALIAGIAGAYLLGHVFGMGAKGYALGFVLGAGIVLGGISIG